MNAGDRCGIDLGPAVETDTSTGSTDSTDAGSTDSTDVGSTAATGGGLSAIATDESTEPTESSGNRSIGSAVVSAVADAKGVDPLDLDPLYEVIDGDALDAIFGAREVATSLELRFTMAGCEVVVRGADDVTVMERSRQDLTGAAPSHAD